MPERIYKLQPDRTMQLRGFDGLGASAALHHATASSFKVSGIFRDSADFAVLLVWDADNFYEHPRLRYLPDMNFAGLVLEFEVTYTGLMPLDSPKYPTIDWPYLDTIPSDGDPLRIPLFEHAELADGNYSSAEGYLTLVDGGMQEFDRVTVWFLNFAFDYIVPKSQIGFQFFAGAPGTVHWIRVAGVEYSYTEKDLDTSAGVAQALVAALANDPKVIATQGDGTPENGPTHQVNLRARVTGSDTPFEVAAYSDPQVHSLTGVSLATVAGALAQQINGVNWEAEGVLTPIGAEVMEDYRLRIFCQRPGRDGNSVTVYTVSRNERLEILEKVLPLSGGSSQARWRIRLDFSQIGLTTARMMWLTFAPPLPNGTALAPTEWQAEFTNWTVTGPEEVRALKVAGPGSVRIEETGRDCAYTGTWTEEAGFYSQGYARRAASVGDSVTVHYYCDQPHELWVGTSLYVDRGAISCRVDGDAPTILDCRLNNDPAVITRRRLRHAVAPGAHTVTLTLVSPGYFYFDFLEAVVPSDVPEPLAPRDHISPALDYSTDHTYKLPPARILWNFDQLGYAGPMNEYIGVFWWNQRSRAGGVIPRVEVTFDWQLEPGDQVFVQIGDRVIGKSVFPDETQSIVASHFRYFINATFVGVWAAASGNRLTVTAHSTAPAYRYDFFAWRISGGHAFLLSYEGSLEVGSAGVWRVDPGQSPPLNRGARDWHADLFAECAWRGREITVANSMELVHPPPEFAARYPDGGAVETDVGFASLKSTHCTFVGAMADFQKQLYRTLAEMMAAAGLTPNLQFGEFLWWFFTNWSENHPEGGMALYHPEIQAAAQSALGRPLHVFRTPDDDPAVNGGADAIFLRNRLRDHVAAIRDYVRSHVPAARFELLFPYDVNYPTPAGVHLLGGRLNRFLNLPVEWESKASSGLDRIKMEGLDFGVWSRDRGLVEKTVLFPFGLDWPKDSIRHLIAIFRGCYTWEKEYWFARSAGVPVINLWAFDHVSIYGLTVPEREYLNRGREFAR